MSVVLIGAREPLTAGAKSTATRFGKTPAKAAVSLIIIPAATGLPQALITVRDCASTAPISASEMKEVRPRLTTAVP